jgi:hypothetical protein
MLFIEFVPSTLIGLGFILIGLMLFFIRINNPIISRGAI